MKYKGFTIEKSENPFYGKFYFISKDGEQYWPHDEECVFTIAQCKKVINNYLDRKL
jgi:hypothetical protein